MLSSITNQDQKVVHDWIYGWGCWIPHLERYERVPRWIIKSPIIEINQSSHQILVDVKNF